jgi:hypothetical protein
VDQVYQTIKFQNSNIKIQINLKVQYPMTKTLATDLSLRKLRTANDDAAGCIL